MRSFHGVHFMAVSGADIVRKFFNLSENTSLFSLQQAALRYCRMPWNEIIQRHFPKDRIPYLGNLCFQASYLFSLFAGTFRFPDISTNDITYDSIEWSLGAAVFEAVQWSDYQSYVCLRTEPFLDTAGGLAAFIVSICVLIASIIALPVLAWRIYLHYYPRESTKPTSLLAGFRSGRLAPRSCMPPTHDSASHSTAPLGSSGQTTSSASAFVATAERCDSPRPVVREPPIPDSQTEGALH